MTDYTIEHWTSGQTTETGDSEAAISISVNHRAATRQAIIDHVRRAGMNFVERSDWAAHKARTPRMHSDWNYTKIAIHHAGRSFACGPGALQLQEIQDMQMGRRTAASDDIGYHYALDCFGNVFEGRDIRFKGENVHNYNTGVIGIVLLENLADVDEGRDAVSMVRRMLDNLGLKQKPPPPERQTKALSKFVTVLCDFFEIHTLGGHREFPRQLGEGKICPGNIGIEIVSQLRTSTGLKAP
ncbi:peptidoglycan recognition family protein [Pandoraea sp. NPDC090278]|uniref:peptidoglycan recognition protein family protein n=1 Tax=Pandoraea sp. NPDC090278 TaxID=3364391 RepID=UPI00383AB13B